jgi:hypothetical protein
MFFDRIAVGLRHLFCHGAHLVGRLETRFPELRHLSIHKVLAASPIFPFIHCEKLKSLALEGEDSYAPTSNFNRLLQDALRSIGGTLEGLILRSGCFRTLDSFSIRAILQSHQIKYLLLDGAVHVDDFNWMILLKTIHFLVVAKIPSWVPRQVSVRP